MTDCPDCGEETTIMIPPFRTGHRPIWKFVRHNRPAEQGGGRCDGSFMPIPNPPPPGVKP